MNWSDRSWTGRIYVLLLLVFVYLIPLGLIIRVTHLRPTNGSSFDASAFETEARDESLDRTKSGLRRHVSDRFHTEETQRLQYLSDDRRFILTTEISIFIYLFAWTPYSLVALGHIFGCDIFTTNPWVMTICPMLAKLSVLFNPMLLTILLQKRPTDIQTSTLI